MTSSMNYPSDVDGDRLRNLLDQRAARTNIRAHCPSVSEFSDSPSVYSRSFLSPRPNDSDLHTSNFRETFTSLSLSDRERLNDPTASSLDFGEDPRSSFCSTDSYDAQEDSIPPNDDEDDASSLGRMSVLGPKMRFHSLAPWELDVESLNEDDEPETNNGYMSSTFGGMFSPGISTVAGGFKKGFRFGSSTARPSTSSRPSVDSSQTKTRSKESFESTSTQDSYGVRTKFQEASPSSTSQVSTSPYVHTNLRSKLSISLEEPDVPPSQVSRASSGGRRRRSPSSVLSKIDTNSSRSSTPSSTCHKADIHPYANPDLGYANEPLRSPLRITHDFFVPRSDSNMTMTATAVRTVISNHAQEPPLSSEPRTPLKSSFQPQVADRLSPKSPGSPGILDMTGDHDSSPYSGWVANTEPPSFTLISLEEARAMRARTTSGNQFVSSSGAFPDGDKRGRSSGSPTDNNVSHGRMRSISTGARAKTGPSSIVVGLPPRSERRDSEPAVIISANSRTVKQKKSGFLRIFNGGREKDKSLPPVPSIARSFSSSSTLAHASTTSLPQPPTISFSAAPATRKARRIPVPPLLPDSTISRGSSPSEPPSGGSSPVASDSPRRLQPGLSINTSSTSWLKEPSPVQSANRLSISTSNRAWSHLAPAPPQSAPPNVTTFEALQLRPTSTVFSQQFGDHFVRTSLDSTAEDESDRNSAISPSPALTPNSPGFSHRIEGRPKAMVEVLEDANLSVVRALQEEINQAKWAWQLQIRELEGQVRALKAELDGMRDAEKSGSICDSCRRAKKREISDESSSSDHTHEVMKVGVVNRPRVRTGSAARFVNGN